MGRKKQQIGKGLGNWLVGRGGVALLERGRRRWMLERRYQGRQHSIPLRVRDEAGAAVALGADEQHVMASPRLVPEEAVRGLLRAVVTGQASSATARHPLREG